MWSSRFENYFPKFNARFDAETGFTDLSKDGSLHVRSFSTADNVNGMKRPWSPKKEIVTDVRMITKMIKENVLSKITLLICDAPNDG